MTEARGRRAGGRWRAATLVAWLGLPGIATAAAAPSEDAAASRFAEAQSRFEQKQYLEAAEIFTEVLRGIEPILLNRATRENVMLNVLTAYEWAYRSSTDDGGGKDVTLLDAGQEVLDEYRATLVRVYGQDAKATPEGEQAFTRFEEARQIAHDKHGPVAAEPEEPEPPLGPCLSPPPPPPTLDRKGCGGDGDPPVALLGLLVLPIGRRRKDAVERFADRLPSDVVRRLRDRD